MSAFRIFFTTRDRMTVECDTLEEAQAKGKFYADRYNKEHHHGEVTTFEVIDLNAKPAVNSSNREKTDACQTCGYAKSAEDEWRVATKRAMEAARDAVEHGVVADPWETRISDALDTVDAALETIDAALEDK